MTLRDLFWHEEHVDRVTEIECCLGGRILLLAFRFEKVLLTNVDNQISFLLQYNFLSYMYDTEQ